jgi:hypothetical protein
LRRSIHGSDDLLPSLRTDLEAGPIGKEALGSLPAALDKELRQGLTVDLCRPLEQRLVFVVDAQIDALRLCSHIKTVHTTYARSQVNLSTGFLEENPEALSGRGRSTALGYTVGYTLSRAAIS